MLTWAFNKDNMSFKLCGTYETMFHTDRKGDEKSRVYINECDYEIPKDKRILTLGIEEDNGAFVLYKK